VRWVRPPAELRRQLDHTERVLALAETAESVVAATNLGLWLPLGGGEVVSWRRIVWNRVVKVTWTEAGLQVIEGDADETGVISDLPTVAVALAEPRNLPSVVRTRVETSIARSESVQVPGGSGRVVARRVPGQDGLVWTARVDTGTPDTEAARAVLRDYLGRVRSAPVE